MGSSSSSISGSDSNKRVCNELPVLFRGTLYLTCALAGGVLFVVLRGFDVDLAVSAWSAFAVTAAIRLGAIYRGWHLPTFALGEPG